MSSTVKPGTDDHRNFYRIEKENIMLQTLKSLTSAAAVSIFAGGLLLAQNSGSTSRNLEPQAGKWKTWIISSGAAFRVPPPPGAAETRAELRVLNDMATQVDGTRRAQ